MAHVPTGEHSSGNVIIIASMADTRSKEQRSRIMRSVGSRDTGPELTIRRLLHRLGYRYTLHRQDLPGRPDIVFSGRKRAIFVHGCFWHGHDCKKGKPPKSRGEYWTIKIKTNRDRDARVVAELKNAGWQTMSIWQCELKNLDAIDRFVRKFLGPPGNERRAMPPFGDDRNALKAKLSPAGSARHPRRRSKLLP
jgi:DNA mismatch endonuclease (patch repair protein)